MLNDNQLVCISRLADTHATDFIVANTKAPIDGPEHRALVEMLVRFAGSVVKIAISTNSGRKLNENQN